jgi:pimeloyl-ACP methyl ester carboxylesterase
MENKLKIVLLNGWNHNHYTGSNCIPYWEEKGSFVSELSLHFEVIPVYLPGFCGVLPPSTAWDIEDYANFLENKLKSKSIYPDIVLGWSFGGAVATVWKNKFNKNTPLVLVSPAITRQYQTKISKFVTKISKLVPNFILSLLRDFYLFFVVKNPYYRKANSVMRKTYRNIIKIILVEEVKQFKEDEVCFFFGENDTATPPSLFLDTLGIRPKNFFVVKNAGHDLSYQGHYVVQKIVQFTKKTT